MVVEISITIRWKAGIPVSSQMVRQRDNSKAMISRPLSRIRIFAVSGFPERNGGTVITNKLPKATGIRAVEFSSVVIA